MTCSQAGEMLSPYLDGELHPRPAARLEAHLAGCVGCRAELAQLRRAVTALRTPPAPVPVEGLLAEFKLRLERETARPTVPVRVPLFPRLLLPTGAVTAVLLAGLLVIRPWAPMTRGESSRLAAGNPQMAMAPPAGRLEERDLGPAPAEVAAAHPPEAPLAGTRSASPPAVPGDRAPAASPSGKGARTATDPRHDRRIPRDAGPRRSLEKGASSVRSEKPRILLPPGVTLPDEPRPKPRKQEKPAAIARQPRALAPAPPGVAGTTGEASPEDGVTASRPATPPAGAAAPSAPSPRVAGVSGATDAPAPPAATADRDRGSRSGWVSIRIVARPGPAAPEALAPSGEVASALSQAAADASGLPTDKPGARQSKQSATARPTSRIAPALLTAMRREVHLMVYDVPLSELVARLGQSAEVGLSLSPQVTADTMRATAELRGLPFHEALAKLAEAAGLTIAPSGAGVLLRPRSEAGTTGRPAIWSAEWGAAPQAGFSLPSAGEKAH
jgi:hypothetical protein